MTLSSYGSLFANFFACIHKFCVQSICGNSKIIGRNRRNRSFRNSLMSSVIKVPPSGDHKLLSPDSSFLKPPSVVPSLDRLSSSCYGKVQGENDPGAQSSPRQSQSAHSKLSTVSLKRSNSSNVPQVSESTNKPQPPFKRPAVLSTGLKSGSNQTFARSGFMKGKTLGSAAGSVRQDKMVAKTTRLTVHDQSKSTVFRSLKNTQASSSAPSRSKCFKALGTPSTARDSGTTTVAAGTKSISSTPNSQVTKSLKDHLAEIREGSTSRGGLNTNPPLRKPSRTATSGASFLRDGAPTSLVPKTKVGSQSPCEEELLVLRQQFGTSLAEWNKVFEVLCIFAQWSLNSKDRLIKEASHREDLLRSQLKMRSDECAQFAVQIKELLQQHAGSQREKAEMWEKERQIMQIDMENLRVTLRTEKEKEIEKVLLQRDADISELQKAYDSQLSEERRKWAARVAESHQKFSRQFDQQQIEHESQIVELRSHNATRVAELENCLKSMELEFSAKVNRLQSECDELRRLSEEAQKNSFETPQQLLPFTQPKMSNFSSTNDFALQEEIESLKTVLELKSAEAADLRQKTMRLEEELTAVKELNKEIKELQNRNENLEALLELRAESQKQLQDRVQSMFHNLEKAVRDKKKLKTECESLRFKLLDAHHKIDQLNAANASEDDSFDMTDSLYMSRLNPHHFSTHPLLIEEFGDPSILSPRSVYSDPRVNNPVASGRSPRPISGTPKSPVDADDRLPAGSFISLDTRPASSSMRLRRGLQHDRSKRRTLATSAELEHHTRH
uniref:Microtubule associated tumor suppressor 1 n=1 Tax=Echinococcus granulosus TaxID=6210 RepID=A0A068WAN4_ECHGR|nr:microtubule associated tumor suppressor 1 [Echinococcus granulosus]